MMHKLIFFFAIFFPLSLIAQTGSSPASNFVNASAPQIIVEGRYATSPAGGVRMGFPGVVLHIHFHGSALTMRVNSSSDEAFFSVTVDGGKPVHLRMHQGTRDYPILNEATAGDHAVEIARLTESWEGVCEVAGFDLGPDGGLLAPPELPTRKFLFIGDSITCGASSDYDSGTPKNERTEHNTQWNNAQKTFCKILARDLDAQCELVSYGGRGMTRDWRGFTTIGNTPQYYTNALPDDPSSYWDPHRYVPDLVAICIGQNDFNQGVPDEKLFVNTYVGFVEQVRHDAPNAWIFLLDSPMLQDDRYGLPKRTILHGYLKEIVAKVNDSRVKLAPVSFYPGNPVDGHPTAANHQAIARELEPIFRKALAAGNT
jgi:lysophospholipase L1-like esterase